MYLEFKLKTPEQKTGTIYTKFDVRTIRMNGE